MPCRVFATACLMLLSLACQRTPVTPLGAAQPAKGRVAVLDAPAQGGDTGWWPVARFDSRGHAHVAYCDAFMGDLRYATQAGGAGSPWTVRSVASRGAVGKYVAMDVDHHDRLGIGYYDQDNTTYRYAWQVEASGAFQDEKVAWGREAGMGATLIFDADDVPHLFYYIGSGKLVHAERRAGGWQREALATAVGVYSARLGAVALPDGLAVSYVDWQMRDAALYLGHLRPSGFVSELITRDNNAGWHSQPVVLGDAAVVVHSVALARATALSRRQAQGWASTPLVPSGSNFAAASYVGGLVVAYADASDKRDGPQLRYARQTAGTWPVWTLDAEGPVGSYLSLTISKTGRLLVAYYADAVKSLKVYDEQLAP